MLEELNEAYGDILQGQAVGLAPALRKIYAKSDKQFIFLIDEWDCVMRERQESELLQKQYLDFLRNLLKDQFYVALVYMTGILPVKKYGLHSALNMYPKSVVEAMSCGAFLSYWTETETYEALKVYIDMDFDGLRTDIVQMLGGGSVKVNTRSFQNDMHNFRTKDDVLTLLIHLGYLAYDSGEETAFIPNREIIGEFENAMSVGGWPEIMRILKASDQLLCDTLHGDADRVAEALDQAHAEAASILTYNDENSLACSIGLAYYSARKDYRLIRELPTGRGFADIVFLPLPSVNKPAIVVELKYDKTAEAAIQQIRDRHYTQVLEGYTGEILAVGINYDRDKANKPHSCVIERLKK